MAQGGEFAFVLYAAALAVGLIDARGSASLTAIIILSMVLTPLLRRAPRPPGQAPAHGRRRGVRGSRRTCTTRCS